MRVIRNIPRLFQQLRQGWLGPHFYYDLIRLARKGWPTLARVLFLGVVLASMLLLNRTQGDSVHFTEPAEFARRAQNFAYLLLVLQDLLILALLPVYVASAIAEEKEHQTLESLTMTHLTDRELVLGKLGARLMHVGAFALANFPLLAFMHLWGNVDAAMLVYHEINLFLMLASGGAVCIWVSTRSETAFQAIIESYAWLALLGAASVIGAFALPWFAATLVRRVLSLVAGGGSDEPRFWSALVPLALFHAGLTLLALRRSIQGMEFLRREERRKTKKTTRALTLTDNRPIKTKIGKRGQTGSRIHPLAWPIRGDPLFWKECVKDGSLYSLTLRWFLFGAAAVAVAAGTIQLFHALFSPAAGATRGVRFVAIPFVAASYVVTMPTYILVVLFQMTTTVAGEREQGTLTFLLSIPVERRAILFAKLLGPWWRNWPILAICYLGIALGFGSGLYDWKAALLYVLLPWPIMLMLGSVALWLSVICRRVMFANIALVVFVALVVLAHVAVQRPVGIALAWYGAVVGDASFLSYTLGESWLTGAVYALCHQAIFLGVAAVFLAHSFWVFRKKDYSAH
jgi:ABC-type transport system involved in multi-copper enzyme maturation permease subunit